MDCVVGETIYSLYGIHSTLNEILQKVVEPLRHLNYGKPCKSTSDKNETTRFGNTPPPKFILLTGKPGCGKGAVASAIVNELRRGPGNKSSDIHYSHHKVRFLGWDRTSWDTDLMEHLRNIFDEVELYDDMTVLLFREFDSVCPNPPSEQPDRHVRRAHRLMRAYQANLISEFCRQLDEVTPGRVLVIGSTSRPELVNKEILSRVEHTFDFPYPNDWQREELFRNFLEMENAILSPPSCWPPSKFMKALVDSSDAEFSAGDIQHIVRAALAHAKMRLRRREPETLPTPIPLRIQDFESYLNLERIEDELRGSPSPELDRVQPLDMRVLPPLPHLHPPFPEVIRVRRIPLGPAHPDPENRNNYVDQFNNDDVNVDDGEFDELDFINDDDQDRSFEDIDVLN